LDSDSTSSIVFLSILLVSFGFIFLLLHAGEVALPLLRRSKVRDNLPQRGFRVSAARRLRNNRYAYEDTLRVLTLSTVLGTLICAFGLFDKVLDLRWSAAIGSVIGVFAILIVAQPIVDRLVEKVSFRYLTLLAALIQLVLWPFIPTRRMFSMRRQGATLTAGEAQDVPVGSADPFDESATVEEQIESEPLAPHERTMIHGILQLEETPVREIMIPRVDVVMIDQDCSLDVAVVRLLESGHSRIPAYKDSPDNVVGVLYSKDLLAAVTSDDAKSSNVLKIMRPCFFIPESKRVDELLSELQERRVHLAVAVDEYGGVAGIVTIEDLLEEIVGEIEDEFDKNEPTIQHVNSGEAIVDARIQVDNFNEVFNAAINTEGFDTIGGFLYSRLGRIPIAGDIVTSDGLSLEVMSTTGRRIAKVRVSQQTDTTDTSEPNSSDN
jgi:putative hemolysin